MLLNVGVAPGNSTSINDTIKNFPVTLENGKNYVAFASGVINPANFAANPDGKNISFNLLVADYARLSSLNAGEVDFIAAHGVTDAPTLDVVDNGSSTIVVDDIAFGDITPYITVAAGSYNINVTPGSNNALVLNSYLADLTALTGQSAVVFASGFVDPAVNQNGPSLGWFAALKDGTVIQFPEITGIDNIENNVTAFQLSPNPASDRVMLHFPKTAASRQLVSVSNTIGEEVGLFEMTAGQNSILIPTSQLNKGLYFIKVTAGEYVSVKKLLVN